ncbi:MAG: hypothetical protein KAG28_02935 [Cocleimonas sp.]|nr:hypothetical protein [Cocleimonas sp.]
MSLPLQHWTLLDSSASNQHHFTKTFQQRKNTGYFAILAEATPILKANNQYHYPSKSGVGAALAVEAAQLAFSQLLKNKLDFSVQFFSLFRKQWQANVFLHAVQHASLNKTLLPVDMLNQNKQFTLEQQAILEQYNASIGILYLVDDQLITFQLGHTEVVLLNRRYNCEIKRSLNTSSFLALSLDDIILEQDKLNTDDYHLEMVSLLSHQYSHSQTRPRLKTNIFKLYRAIGITEAEYEQQLSEDMNFILFRKNKVTLAEKEHALPLKKQRKKSLITHPLSLLVLCSTLASGYYLLGNKPIKITEVSLISEKKIATTIAPSTMAEKKKPPIIVATTEITKQTIASEGRSSVIPLQRESEPSPVKLISSATTVTVKRETSAEKQNASRSSHQRLTTNRSTLKAVSQRMTSRKKATKTQQRKASRYNMNTAEKRTPSNNKSKKVVLQKRRVKRDKQKTIKKEQKEIKLKIIEKAPLAEKLKVKTKQMTDIKKENIRRQEKYIKDQQRENLKQEKLLKEKKDTLRAQQKNKIALIKKQEKQQSRTQKPQAKSTLKTREQHHLKAQQYTQAMAEEKRKRREATLKQQQQRLKEAKAFRQKNQQQTLIHQLMSYSKKINQYITALKRKDLAINVIDKKLNNKEDARVTHQRILLITKKELIKHRIDAVTKRYLIKLKKICTSSKIYPVITPPQVDKIGWISLSLIKEQLRDCSKKQTLSYTYITAQFLKKF